MENEQEIPIFTEDMVDEFVEQYILVGLEELQSIECGKFILQASDYAWQRKR